MKNEDVKNMSVEDIDNKIKELRLKLQDLRFQNSISTLENPVIIREVRRNVARLLTEKTIKLNN